MIIWIRHKIPSFWKHGVTTDTKYFLWHKWVSHATGYILSLGDRIGGHWMKKKSGLWGSIDLKLGLLILFLLTIRGHGLDDSKWLISSFWNLKDGCKYKKIVLETQNDFNYMKLPKCDVNNVDAQKLGSQSLI